MQSTAPLHHQCQRVPAVQNKCSHCSDQWLGEPNRLADACKHADLYQQHQLCLNRAAAILWRQRFAVGDDIADQCCRQRFG